MYAIRESKKRVIKKHDEAITSATPERGKDMNELKKLRCKKEFGIWYYRKLIPSYYNDLDSPIYELYDEKQNLVMEFGCYDEMKYYLETGHTY